MNERQFKTESLKTRKTNNCAKRNAENTHTHARTDTHTTERNNNKNKLEAVTLLLLFLLQIVTAPWRTQDK